TGLGHPMDGVLSPLGDRAYVGNQWPDSQGRGFISVIDTISEALIAIWPVTGTVGFADIDISPDGQMLYVVDNGGYFIRGLDTLTGAVVSQDETNIEGYTFDMEIFPAEAGPYYYAANPYDPLIAVVNRETNQLEKW